MLGELAGRCRSAASAPTRSALGREATDNGTGMLLGNPHFPWDGSERFYQAQLTIPGKSTWRRERCSASRSS